MILYPYSLIGCVLWRVSIFVVVAFYDLGCISCPTIGDLFIVSIENCIKGAVIGEVFGYEI